MTVAKDGVIDTTDELLSQVEHFQGIVNSFFEQPLPDACEALVYRCDVANRSGSYLSAFERYAARLLRGAQCDSLRRVFSRHEIGVGRLSVTGLCWLSFDRDVMTPSERHLLVACESAINRIILLFKASLDAEGIAALSAADGEDYCMFKDGEAFSSLGSEVGTFAALMQSENPLQIQYGVTASKGGEWDTRTRFARMMESIVSPFRIEYRFDCQVDRGLFEVHVSSAAASVMPPHRNDGTLSVYTDSCVEGQHAALSYAFRLSALVAGAAFFSNVAITHVVVTCHRESVHGEAFSSLYFERMPYLLNVVPALGLGELSSDSLTFDPLSLAVKLATSESRFACDEEGRLLAIEPLQVDFDERRCPVWRDGKTLPENLQQILHADSVDDLDVVHVEDPALSRRVTEASFDAEEYPVAALSVFEDVLSILPDKGAESSAGSASASGLDSSCSCAASRPLLYCQDEVARVLIGLIDRSQVRYEKCPDYVFLANQKSASVNAALGDVDAARLLFERGIELAPSSTAAYVDLAAFELEQGSADAAVRLLSKALLFSFRPSTVEYVYYRLAYALYRSGRAQASIAAYVVVVHGKGRFSQQAALELRKILQGMGVSEVPDYEEALAWLRKEEIPDAPSSFVSSQVVRALFGLVEMGSFKFASALCSSLSEAVVGPDRDILNSVATSLFEGVEFDFEQS